MNYKNISNIGKSATLRDLKCCRMLPVVLGGLVAVGNLASVSAVGNASTISVQQQNITVKGNVVGTNGESLIGVNVLEKGTSNGTITDFDGNFSLSVAPGAVLVFSYIGYESIEVPASQAKDMKVVLQEDTKKLEEVVVIGYGAVKKADLAGSVAVLDNKNFKDQPVTRVADALQGRVAGVQVESSGVPGGSVKIRVRGSGSVNKSNDPLYVVDGIVRESGLDGINPEDIKSMQVLKDASSTAIYGSRGSNGVVLISTKTGQAGRTQITLDASFGVSNVYKRYDVLSPYEYALALKEVKGTDFSEKELNAYKDGTSGIDWQDEIFRSGLTQNYKVSVSSGNEKTQYYISGNYMGQTGVVINSKNERYQAKLNVTSDVTPWLHVAADINASHSLRKGGNFATGKENPIWIALNYSPTMTMMDDNGNYNKDQYNAIASNPVGILNLHGGETMANVLNGYVDLRFNLLKGLTFTSTNGLDYNDTKSYSFSSTRVNPSNGMGNTDLYSMMLQSSNNLTYMGQWNKHSLTATAVYEVTKRQERTMGISGKNLLTESVGWWNVNMSQSISASNGITEWALMSGVGRVLYNYDERYLLTATFRADGSSRFSKNKWGYFPSIAAAWTISNEKFMRNVSAIQDLKIRSSYGIVGNQAINPYSTLGLMAKLKYNFGTANDYTGYWAADIATPELTWEKTRQFDLGVDFSLFDRRLNVSVDYFNKRTTDALLQKTVPGYKGGSTYWVNDGEISNKGVDISINAALIQNKNFSWSTTLNGTYLKNKVEKLAGGENDFFFGSKPAAGMVDEATIIKPGYAIGSFYGYEWTGLDKNGNDTYLDRDNNGVIDGSDRTVIGKATPDFTFGWNNTLTYKNWDLNVFVNGSFGAQRLNLVRFTMASMVGDSRFVTLREAYFNGFDKVGQGAEYPSLTGSGNNYQAVSTKWMENADYVRLENISLSYTFPRSMTKFADIRLSFSCQNLFTITGYKGLDPAGSTFSTSNVDVDAGIDMGAYPTPRTFTFGVRMNF